MDIIKRFLVISKDASLGENKCQLLDEQKSRSKEESLPIAKAPIGYKKIPFDTWCETYKSSIDQIYFYIIYKLTNHDPTAFTIAPRFCESSLKKSLKTYIYNCSTSSNRDFINVK
jgi:hypothetical protein